ncbi:M16 family metallopeptidase [Micropruina glycogenica]|uniref:Predicted Zn-dependent peptidase n=1 Tax=Micropruina glycogenica TaxID=75385 RepID=A0A2N9JFG2_9ACTN|nr:pitrilysin family protein [Micropruina glycogenica]SPD86225.1 Predicted Zn-dependent peptidase [Micropruina glycogenica]
MNRPAITPPQPWTFPTPTTTHFDNGMTVLKFDRPGQHLIDATLVLDLPLHTERASIEGVSAILQRCLDEGTRSHPRTDFAEQLENRGAVLNGGVSHSATHVSLEVPTTRFAEALPLFAEAVLEPTLEAADVRRHVELRLAEIGQHRAHPTHRGAEAFRAAVIDDDFRAARSSGGTAASVRRISTDDVHAHYAAHYGPERATLVLAGDFTDDPLPVVRDAFEGWSRTVTTLSSERPLAAPPQVLLIDRPAAVQADVRLGGFGIDRTDPRWPALRLGAFVLGGGFLSRLNRVLREERGYTYGVQLSNTPARHGGLLAMHASFRTEVAAAAIAEARELIRVDGDGALTEAELTDARNFLVGIMPLRCATAAGVADQAAALIDVGLDTGFVNRHAAALELVTPEQATAAIAELLQPDRLSLVVVGDAAVLADQLAAQGLDATVISDPSV